MTLGLWLGSASLEAAAQPRAAPPLPSVEARSGEPRITVDGQLDEAVWARAPRFDGFQKFRPDIQADVGGYRTEVQIVIERDALVFGIRAHDPNPSEIRAPLTRRDKVTPQQDSVTVWIDPQGRGQFAQFVVVNPRGAMGDGLYSAAQDDDDASPDYTEVETAGVITADGYTVEVRWPLANLRYPIDGALPWGLMVTRRVPRQAMAVYSSAPLERDTPHLLTRLHTLADDAALKRHLGAAQHLTVRPEITLRHASPTEPGQRQTQANLGAEVQWRPRADWVIDATIRPDFSQVEIDEPQFKGNTAFALFLQEKRAFFLESSDAVGQVPPDDFGTSRGLMAFYSRAIVDPRWGLRATHRGQASQATAMALRDAGGGLVLRPNAFGTDATVVRQSSQAYFARHTQHLTPKLQASALGSVRDWGGGASTQVAGVDAQWQATEGTQFRGHLLANQHRTQVQGNAIAALDQPRRAQAYWLSGRTRQGLWRYTFDAERIGANFVHDNAFIPQSGIDRLQLEAHLAFHPNNAYVATGEWHLRWMGVQALRNPELGLFSPQAVSRVVQPGYWVQTAFGLESWGFLNFDRLRVRPGGVIHDPISVNVGGTYNPGSRWTLLGFNFALGEGVDRTTDQKGQSWGVGTTLEWRFSLPHGMDLELEQQLAANRISSRTDASGLTQQSAQSKALLHLNREQAVRWLWQQQSARRDNAAGGVLDANRTQVGTLTWLAKAGNLRGWSLGVAHAQETLTGGVKLPARREVFVKYQQLVWPW